MTFLRVVFIVGSLFGLMGASYLKSPSPTWHDTRVGGIFEPQDFDYRPKILVHASAFCPCPKCCGRFAHINGGGWTASGVRAIEGITIAADPAFLPFNTCLDIPNVGKRIVEDTGSAIKMFHIDVFFKDHTNALIFGFQRNLLVGFCDEEL